MLRVVERASALSLLDSLGFDKECAHEYDLSLIKERCETLRYLGISSADICGRSNIQAEIMENEQFANVLKALLVADINPLDIENLLPYLKLDEYSINDYSSEQLIDALQSCKPQSVYCYLKYYSHRTLSPEERENLINNLDRAFCEKGADFSSLNETDLEFFLKPYIACENLFPMDSIMQIVPIVSADDSLEDIVKLLCDAEYSDSLSLRVYSALETSSKEAFGLIHTLKQRLGDHELFENALAFWISGECSNNELRLVLSRMNGLNTEEIANHLASYTDYINLLYGGAAKLQLSELPRHLQKLIIYALSNRKRAFIRLLEENTELICSISSFSLLFQSEFFRTRLNINTLTKKNIRELNNLVQSALWKITLLPEQEFTFEEIKLLYGKNADYISLYQQLNISSIDKRLLVMRQITKKMILPDKLSPEQLEQLAEKLSIQPLNQWMTCEFSHIDGLSSYDAIRLLGNYHCLERFIPEMLTHIDVAYALRNANAVSNCASLAKAKQACLVMDDAWQKLKSLLKIDDEFIKSNRTQIIKFIMQNGAHLVLTYINSNRGKLEAISRIVKAELMGRFGELKYFRDDLIREIEFAITDNQKEVWAHNSKLCSKEVLVKEYDDLYITMQMGELPQHTCLSYIDGSCNECLLSCFDSNKKLLFASINGKIVGRAIIRLTKARFSSPGHVTKDTSSTLEFVDLENIEPPLSKPKNKSAEYLALFLERAYIAGVTPEITEQVKHLFIRIVKQKANKLNAMLVLSGEYPFVETFTRTALHLYISKSKGGAQYFDSLGGSAYVSNEGSYRSNSFYVPAENLEAVS